MAPTAGIHVADVLPRVPPFTFGARRAYGKAVVSDPAMAALPTVEPSTPSARCSGDHRRDPWNQDGDPPTHAHHLPSRTRAEVLRLWQERFERTHGPLPGEAGRPGSQQLLEVSLDQAEQRGLAGSPRLVDPADDLHTSAAEEALDISAPRWTAYDAVRFGVQMDPEIPMTTQEQANTSPIWYTP